MTNKLKFLLMFLLMSSIGLYAGESPLANFIKTVDWTFMGDKTRFSLDLCKCDIVDGGKGAGFKVTIAEPIAMLDNTNTPWNVVALGAKFDDSLSRKQNKSRNNGQNRRLSHFIAFPVMSILNFVQDYVCFERLSFTSFMYWSEIIPTQLNDIMAIYAQVAKGPLSKIWYNNPLGMLACVTDCAAVTFNKTINSLHWCAGCAGITGNNTAYGQGKDPDPIMQIHANALSVLDDLHYAGSLSKVSNATFAWNPTSVIPNTMCKPAYFPMAIKSQYYVQLAYPTVWDAVPIGKFAMSHANFKNKPNSEDDVSAWIWVVKDSCAGGAGCKSMFTREVNN